MRLHKRTARLILIPVAAIALGVSGPRGTSSAATPMMTPMPMGHHTGPVSFMNDHQVAPAVTKMLMHASVKTCGHMVMGSGYVKMIPVHVGMMGTAPHVDLVVSVQGAGIMRKFGISGTFVGPSPEKWSGMAGSASTGMHGNLYTKMRLMPMMRAGSYTAQIFLHDTSCSGMMNLAYETPKSVIRLK
ncbi:MAG TPA: hypothetical protein VIO57_05435 [Chloroflexota bacterium]